MVEDTIEESLLETLPQVVPVEAEDEAHSDFKQHPVYTHWVRPKFQEYNYMYDYRRNYYDDCIDYLDRRQRGFRREIPRAQTWAERALRTYVNKSTPSRGTQGNLKDVILLSHISTSTKFYQHHSKAYITRKYSSIL